MSKTILVKRTGVCSKCGKSVLKKEIKITHMHHTTYKDYDKDHLANTVELCAGCHRTEHAIINKNNNPKVVKKIINIQLDEDAIKDLDKIAERNTRKRKQVIELLLGAIVRKKIANNDFTLGV